MTLNTKNIGYWYTNNPDDYLFKDINLSFEKGKFMPFLVNQEVERAPFFPCWLAQIAPKQARFTQITKILINQAYPITEKMLFQPSFKLII